LVSLHPLNKLRKKIKDSRTTKIPNPEKKSKKELKPPLGGRAGIPKTFLMNGN